jgi:putative transposase
MRKQYTAAFKAHLVREVLKEEKPLNQIAVEHGVHRNLLTAWRDHALAGLPSLFSRQAELDQATKDAAHAQQVHELYAEIGKLSTHVAWLKKKLATSLTRAERLTLLERADAELPLLAQTDLLGLNRRAIALEIACIEQLYS